MRKLLASSLMVVGTVSAVALGTRAFFSDTETSSANTFQAGAIDLRIDSTAHYNGMICVPDTENDQDTNGEWVPENFVTYSLAGGYTVSENYNPTTWNTANPAAYPKADSECWASFAFTDLNQEKFFDLYDIKPGDEGENTISMHVFNNDAWACMLVDGLTDDDVSLTEPEQDTNDTLQFGELSSEMMVFAWMETDGDNLYEGGTERALTATPMSFKDFAGKNYALADSSLTSGTGGVPLPGVEGNAASGFVGMQWCAGTLTLSGTTLSCDGQSMGNEAQTDKLTADISFTIEQSRNNEEFVCPSNVVEVLASNWPTLQPGNTAADLRWQAEARFGNNNASAGDWEVGVGTNTANSATMSNVQGAWTSGVNAPFTVSYNGTTGIATLTVGSYTANYNVGTNINGDLYIVAKGSSATNNVQLSNLMLDGSPLANPTLSSVASPPSTVKITGSNLGDGFQVTGQAQFNWTTIPSGSGLAFQVQVLN